MNISRLGWWYVNLPHLASALSQQPRYLPRYFQIFQTLTIYDRHLNIKQRKKKQMLTSLPVKLKIDISFEVAGSLKIRRRSTFDFNQR